MSAFDLIIFDCDGVLVDSEQIANEVLSEVFAGYGIAMSAEKTRATFIGQSVDDIRITAERETGVLMPEDWSVGYYAALIPALADRVGPVPGVAEIIDLLEMKGVPFCVASQGPMEKIRTTLTRAGFWNAFAGRVYSAKSVERPKPAPDLFLHAARSIGVPPEKCAVIEDSVLGIQAGVAAGMTVFAYCPPEDVPRMERLGATAFTDMSALPGLICLP